jgi:cellulose biosynthesis protein BcsQ
MSIPVLTFSSNKGRIGKTSLVYHLSWIFSEMGRRVVTIDLDPQANLTSAFLVEEKLEELWDTELFYAKATTIYRCVQPLMEAGDIQTPITQRIRLFPGTSPWPNSRIFFPRSGRIVLAAAIFCAPSAF